MRRLLVAVTLAALAACATSTAPAEAQAGGQAAAQAAAPSVQRFALDGAHTQAAFSADRFGFSRVMGRFDAISGEVTLDQTNPERSSVIATIQVQSLNSGNATRDEHLRGEMWLHAAQFPTMEFRSTSVRRTGENTAQVSGNMTIRGVTQPATLDVTLIRSGRSPANGATVAGFTATATISRTAFGIGVPRPPVALIGDDVRITIEALAEAPRAQ